MKKRTTLKFLAPLVLALLTTVAEAQCSFSGLGPAYCRNAAAVTLTPSVGGGSFSGPGMVNNVFNPSLAGGGTHTITYGICTTSYNIASGTFSLISTGGNGVSLSDDALSGSLPIGFPFEFFCTTYTAFAISSNGFITFDVSSGANGCCSGQFLPDANTPNNLIAYAWEDLNPSSGGTITYTTIGTQPNRVALITFSAVPHYPSGNNITAQIQLHENGDVIEIHTATMPTDGGSHTMGIENASGNIGYPVTGRNASGGWSATNEMYSFTPINNCVTSQTTMVDATNLTIAGPSTLCLHSSVTFTASGTTTYTWNTGATTAVITDTPQSTTVYTVSGLAPGSLGCVYSTPFTLTVHNTPVSAYSTTSLLCVGSTATLTGQGASTYTWSSGGNNTTTTVNPTTSTTYTLYGTSNLGCVDQFVINQDVNTNTVVLSPDTAVCLGSGVTLTASNVVTYTWSNPPSPFASISVTPNVNTVYSMMGTDQYGCVHSGAVTVSVNPIPNVTITSPKTTVCRGDLVKLTGNGASTYTWSFGGTGSTGTVIPMVDVPQTYTVMGTDDKGCKDGASINITVQKCSGIAEQGAASLFDIYPNPGTGLFYVRGAEGRNLSARVFNTSGALVLSVDHVTEKTAMDLSSLASGVYLVHINENKNLVQTIRIVKE